MKIYNNIDKTLLEVKVKTLTTKYCAATRYAPADMAVRRRRIDGAAI